MDADEAENEPDMVMAVDSLRRVVGSSWRCLAAHNFRDLI